MTAQNQFFDTYLPMGMRRKWVARIDFRKALSTSIGKRTNLLRPTVSQAQNGPGGLTRLSDMGWYAQPTLFLGG